MAKENNLAHLIASSACLTTIAQTSDLKEAELLMEFVGGLKVTTKQLLILTHAPLLIHNSKAFLNKTKNVDVTVIQKNTGKYTN